MRILTTLAVKGALDALRPQLEAIAAGPLDLQLAPTAVMLQRIATGERGDLAILTAPGIAQLCANGTVDPASRTDLAHSLIGLAVRSGTARPDISTLAAFERTLVETPSLVYSKGGASGIFFAGLLDRMGLRAVVDAKATIIASGFTAEPVARGEAVLAVQQISELMVVAGVDIVGPLPAGAQESLLFSAAVFVAAPKPVEGAAVLALLASPAASEVFSRTGLLPIARRPEPAA